MIYLAASTPPGHELHYFEAKREGAESADLYSCDLVAISTFSAQILEAYAVADHLREAGVRVTMGGLHVTVQLGESLQHADYVFLGEGENTWPVAVTAIDHGKAQRVWHATDFPPIEVGLLPVPRYDLLAGHPSDSLCRRRAAALGGAISARLMSCSISPTENALLPTSCATFARY